MTDLTDWLRSALDDVARLAKRDEPGCNCRDLGCHHTELRDLAERTVQAHREILDRHAPDNDMARDPYCSRCSCVNAGCDYFVDSPCPDVRSLAAIYQDQHPGFGPSWIGERS